MSESFDVLSEEEEREWLRARRRRPRPVVQLAFVAAGLVTAGLALRVTHRAVPAFIARPGWVLLTVGVVLLAVGGLAALTLLRSGGWLTLPVARRVFSQAEFELHEQLRDRVILPLLRDVLTQRLPSFNTELEIPEAPGLGEVFDPFYEIPSATSKRLRRLLARMPGGSIGVSGPRGAGKTTLIRSFCVGKLAPTGDGLSTMVSAPVEYTARDFVLHLFATLCEKVLGQADDEDHPQLRRLGSGTGIDASPSRSGRLGDLYGAPRFLAAYGLVLVIAGVGLLLLFVGQVRVDPRVAWGLGLLLVGGLLIDVGRPALRFGRGAGAPASSQEQRDRLRAIASRYLRQIRYQQTVSSGWTGAAKAPIGLEATLTGSATDARVQLSFPEIIAKLRRFLEHAAEGGQVVIGIDELDKLPSDEKARQFLNEIKAIFGVRNCYFLVSISEEAMASFERRGLPFRDVFDSSLDAVVHVPYLYLDDAQRLLNRRVVFPVPFLCLCYCLSGGLARELIRTARSVVEAQPDPEPSSDRTAPENLSEDDLVPLGGLEEPVRPVDTPRPVGPLRLADAAFSLVGEEVRIKTAATIAGLKDIDLEPEVSEVVQWCQAVGVASPDALAVTLLGRCQWLAGTQTLRPGHKDEGDQTLTARQTVFRLTRELAVFYYYAATVLQFFADLDEQRLRRVLSDRTGPGSLEQLASCRQAFAINPRIAWNALSTFRRAVALDPVDFPEVLLWARRAPATKDERSAMAPMAELPDACPAGLS